MERGVGAMTQNELRANPFAVNRWETESIHRIWIPPDVSIAAELKACFISGLRGTGKTVFLNCLDILAPDRSNYRFLNRRALPKSCIGVYINILSEFTHYFYLLGAINADKDRDENFSSIVHPLAFQTYLIFHAIGRSFSVVDDCRRHDRLDYTTSQESAFVSGFKQIWQRHFLDGTASEIVPTTLLDCATAMNRVCMAIRVNSMRLYADRVRSLIEAVQPIAFYHEVCALLLEHNLLMAAQRQFHIKICLDDAHRVAAADQRLINAILAVNSAPIGWNVSFITGRYDANSTLDQTAPLTDHDVNRIDLNYQDDYKGFKRLCSKMYNMRVLDGRDDGFSAANGEKEYWQILGRPSAAVLFGHLLGKTDRDSFRAKINDNLQYVAEKLQEHGVGTVGAAQRNHSDARRYLPQTYMFNVLFNGNRREFEHFLQQRSPKQLDNYFRQKNVAALICAANEIGADVPYAGLNMLVSLADGCVRDFLQILSILYNDAASSAHGRSQARRQSRTSVFEPDSQGMLSIDEQSPSFIEASRRYVDHVAPTTDRTGRVLLNLVLAVGALQKLLQSRDRFKALAMPERGLIEFNFNETTLYADQNARELILRQAMSAGQYIGVIRILKGIVSPIPELRSVEPITFRLHHLTAPAFNVSARGPIHAVVVPLHAMLEFAEERVPDPQVWAQRVYEQIRDQKAVPVLSATRQAELFESNA